jgi:transposase
VTNTAPPSADQSAKIAALEAALAERDATILRQVQIIADAQDKLRQAEAEKKITALCIEKLELRVHKLLRKRFGSSSEQLDQLRLGIEDLEADQSERAKGEPEEAPATDAAKPAKARDRKLSDKLKRRTVVREPKSGSCCPDCGGGLRLVGEDSDEMLDLVTQVWEVLQTIRPKYSCRTCDRIVQASPPPKPIAKGKLTFATLAHIIVAKWGYHLPFYRQSTMMAAKGVDMDRSTLARSAGYAAHLIDPIYNRLRELGRQRNKLHTDDTRIPMLDPGTGKTHKAFLWTYVADDRSSGSTEPPIVWFRFTTGRGGENVEQELGNFRGYLQADGFAGYNRLYAKGIFEVGCYAHWRRKLFDLHEAQPTATTTGFMARIQRIYRIEEEIRGLPPAERLAVRRSRSRPLVQELGRFAKQQLALMSPRSETATALNYGLKRWRAFNRFLYNGELEIDNLIAERSIRGITIGRRNWLFAGSEEGGKRAAKILSIIETCKLCGVEPEAYMADVMEKIADDWPASRWDELMPWNWAPKSDDQVDLAA